MALSSHVSLKRLSALNAGCSFTACSLFFAKGCPACKNVALGPGIRDSSLDITEQYSFCTVLSTPLPRDVTVIPMLSIAGRHVSGTTIGVPCISSLGAWVHRYPCASDASLESWFHDSSHSCGSTLSTCLLSHGAEATTRSDDFPALSCGGDAPRGPLLASTVASGLLALQELSFLHILQFDDPASGWVRSSLMTQGAEPPLIHCVAHEASRFFVGSTSHLLHTRQESVMITEDFGTHLAAGRWRSKVLRL